MANDPWRPRRIPRWRHWFSGPAILGVLLTAYNVLVGIIGIAPITQSDLKWALFAVGALLSVGIWYSLALDTQSRERKARRALATGDQVAEIHLAIFGPMKAELERVGVERRDIEQLNERLGTRLAVTYDQLDVALGNDRLASDTMGAIVRTLSDSDLSLDTRVAATRDLVRDFVRDRTPLGERLLAARKAQLPT